MIDAPTIRLDWRRKDNLTPALAAALALHLGVFAALTLLHPMSSLLPAGSAVPIEIVAEAPSVPTPKAEAAPAIQSAAAETPAPEPTPEPALAAPAAPAPTKSDAAAAASAQEALAREDARAAKAADARAVADEARAMREDQARQARATKALAAKAEEAKAAKDAKAASVKAAREAEAAAAKAVRSAKAAALARTKALARTAPAANDLDLDALAASVARAARAHPGRPAGAPRKAAPRPRTAPSAVANATPGVSASEMQGLQQLLERLWNPDCSVEGGDGVVVRVRFTIGPAGRVIGRVSTPQSASGDGVVAAAALRAIDAVHEAEPFAESYRNNPLTVNFDARKACSGR